MTRTPGFRTLPWWTWLLIVLAVLGLLVLSIEALSAETAVVSSVLGGGGWASGGGGLRTDLRGTGKGFTLLTS